MKLEKINKKIVQNYLTRDEMREIMAGSGSNSCSASCVDAGAPEVVNCVSICFSGGVLDCWCYECCMAQYCGGICT